MRCVVAVRSDTGQVRDLHEDSYLVREPVFVIADGMGGHLAGDVASQTAIEIITANADGASADPHTLEQIVLKANEAIWNKAQSDPSMHGMGTTCTLVFLEGDKAYLAHVGDSRGYVFQDGHLRQVTEDHTLVERMVKEGRLERAEAARHPQRNIITRALGMDANVKVDTFSLELNVGDRLLLCSDGLNSMLSDEEVEQVLKDHPDGEEAADRLIQLANAAGGEDNITVILIDMVDGSGAAARSSPAADASTPVATPPPDTSSKAQRVDTDPASAGRLRPRWGRIVVAALLVIAILAAAGYVAIRYIVLERSFYVGISADGHVTIYRGLPGEIAGLELAREEEVTPLEIDQVPEFLQDNVRAGITTESLAEAQQRVDDLAARAEDEEFGGGETRNDGSADPKDGSDRTRDDDSGAKEEGK